MQNETNKRVVCDITSPTLSIYIYTLVFGAQNPQTEGGRLGSCSSLCVCACFGFLESAQKDSLHACFKHFQPDMGFPHPLFQECLDMQRNETQDALLLH